MPSWSVAIVDAASEAAYATLIAAAPASPLSHTLLWQKALRDLDLGEPLYWLALRDGQARGALPAFVRRGSRGTVLNSLPFVQSTGGVITPADATPTERAATVTLLVSAMLAHCRKAAIDIACLVGSPYRGDEDAAAFPRPPDFHMVRVTNAVDLRAPFEPRASTQWTVRKADRLAPQHRVATTAAEARAVYDLYAAGMEHLQVAAHPWRLFESTFAGGINPAGARFVWAEIAGQMVSGLILMVHNQVVDYYCVGNTDEGRRLQISSWLIQREIEEARARGARWWNWGVSPSPAVHDFKKRWGGSDLPYTIWGFFQGDLSAWHRLSPADLTSEFPGYFVLPYDRLRSAPAGPEGVHE